MEFIEMTGKQLLAVMQEDEFKPQPGCGERDRRSGRSCAVNRQGDLEVRRKSWTGPGDAWEIGRRPATEQTS